MRAELALGILAFFFCSSQAVFAQSGEAGKDKNRILSVSMDMAAEQPTVAIKTQEPVGYRYTVYDSSDPVRVVIDFPGMDVSGIASTIKVDSAPVQEIRVSSFDLTSGRLGRIELLLSAQSNYNVFLTGNDFRVTFAKVPGTPAAPSAKAASAGTAVESAKPVSESAVAPPTEPAAKKEQQAPPASAAVTTTPATVVKSVDVKGNRADIQTDGRIDRYQDFTLGAPPRLVVDIFGIKPAFKERAFKAGQGFDMVRVGTYPDKTRFVFDAEGKALPKHAVAKEGNAIIVTWGEKTVSPAAKVAATVPGAPVTVEAVDFKVENGKSVLAVTLSGPAELIDAAAEGDVVRFGIKNALIGRSLRRTIDASAFPSAVRLITPYTVQVGRVQDVRFAAELKGPVAYSLQKTAEGFKFVIDNGAFAEPAPAAVSKMAVPVAAVPPAAKTPVPVAAAIEPAPKPLTDEIPAVSAKLAMTQPRYTGQKISLVFDDAEIRRILQLVAEVSELNIIVSDEVKGTISLRLIDVPWDQALDLIMDIKGLGMVRQGNVVRIMPREQIRAEEEAKLTAARTKEKLEDLVTEVVAVSYTNIANIAGPAKELLTERGKITEDARNKKLIVKDIPSVVAEIRQLATLLDTPERQVMIEARIVEADTTFIRNLGVNWGLQYQDDAVGPWDPSSAAISGGGSFVISPSASGVAGLGSRITFGLIPGTSTQLDLKLSALETSSYGKVISTPRVSTLNGQSATISQGTKIPYKSSGDDGLPKTEFVDANLQLTVTPEINPDNSIILDISATNSTPTAVEGIDEPGIATKEAKTKLLVRDGETTVIGGIFVEDESDSEAGIPLLRRIPYFGHLFKSSTKSNNRSELLIFITPKIVR